MKIKLLAFSLFLNLYSIFAQSPDWKWAKNFSAYKTSIASDSLGNCWIAGSFITPTLQLDTLLLTNANATTNFFIAKFTSNGKILWAKNGGSNCDITKLSVDKVGNALVIGDFEGTLLLGNDTLHSGIGSTDIFVAKFDSSGNISWTNGIGGNGYEFSKSIAVDNLDNVLITGDYLSSTLYIDTLAFSKAGGQGTFIAKYSPSGNLLWAQTAIVSNVGRSYGVATDAYGNCYWAGTYDGASITFGTQNLTSPGPGSFYLFNVKLDANGIVLWAKKGVGYNLSVSITADRAGNTYIAGNFLDPTMSFDNTVLTNANLNYSDIYLVKYDSNGNLIWARRFGYNNDDWASAIAIDKQGNPCLVGTFDNASISFDLYDLTNKSSNLASDIFITKFNPDGNVIWAKSAGGYGQDEGQSISVDAQNEIYISGALASTTVEFGIDTLVYTQGTFYAAKLDSIPTIACSAVFAVMPDTIPHHYLVLNQSYGAPQINYLWYWGDGNISSGANPTHTYSTNGNYAISLATTDSLGCIAVYSNPVAYFYKNADATSVITITVVAGNPLSVETTNKVESEFNLFPNPSEGEINMSASVLIESVLVYSSQGALIFEAKPNSKIVHLSLASAGLYFVSASGKNFKATRKITVLQ